MWDGGVDGRESRRTLSKHTKAPSFFLCELPLHVKTWTQSNHQKHDMLHQLWLTLLWSFLREGGKVLRGKWRNKISLCEILSTWEPVLKLSSKWNPSLHHWFTQRDKLATHSAVHLLVEKLLSSLTIMIGPKTSMSQWFDKKKRDKRVKSLALKLLSSLEKLHFIWISF